MVLYRRQRDALRRCKGAVQDVHRPPDLLTPFYHARIPVFGWSLQVYAEKERHSKCLADLTDVSCPESATLTFQVQVPGVSRLLTYMNAEFRMSTDCRYSEMVQSVSIAVKGSLNRYDGPGKRDMARMNKSDPGGDRAPGRLDATHNLPKLVTARNCTNQILELFAFFAGFS